MRRDPVAVATASSPAEAQVWVDMLLDEGILATSLEIGTHGAFGGGSLMPPHARVLVDRSDLARARNVIAESGGAAALSPVPTDAPANASLVRATYAVAVVVVLLLLVVLVLGGVR